MLLLTENLETFLTQSILAFLELTFLKFLRFSDSFYVGVTNALGIAMVLGSNVTTTTIFFSNWKNCVSKELSVYDFSTDNLFA